MFNTSNKSQENLRFKIKICENITAKILLLIFDIKGIYLIHLPQPYLEVYKTTHLTIQSNDRNEILFAKLW